MKRYVVLLFSVLFIAACGGGRSDYSYESDMASPRSLDTSADATRSSGDEAEQIPLAGDRKVIKDGRMGIRVGRLEETKGSVDGIVKKFGGYYSKENYTEGSYMTEYDLTIRVPSVDYESMIAAIEAGEGTVLYKNIDARDVTEQYFDTELRLANKRASLERYRELLRKATNIEEILKVEEYIRRLVEEIEAAEGKLRLLNNQLSYSTLNLNISRQNEYKFTVPEARSNFWQNLGRALSTGWTIVVKLVLGLVTIWPILLITAVILFVIFRNRRKTRK